MAQLLLILVGGREVRRRWWLVALVGLVWGSLGLFFFANAVVEEVRIFTDALIEEIHIQPVFFAIPLVVEGGLSLVAALDSAGGMRLARLGKVIGLFAMAVLIVLYPWHSGMLIGFLFGTLLALDAVWRGTTANIVRYAGWRLTLAYAAFEFVIGCWSFIPLPTDWDVEVGADLGTWLFVSGVATCAVALRLRRLSAGRSVAALFARGWPDAEAVAAAAAHPPGDPPIEPSADPSTGGQRCDVTVHVWTPTGRLVAVHRGISRYVAARDETGNLSTGHAALEAPGLYVSHYPAVEIDRSVNDFRRALRATADNDVPGRFQASYAVEAAEWQPSTRRVVIRGLDASALGSFWAAYRLDTHYNLTNRNCSSAVAKALDAGLEGLFEMRSRSFAFMARLLMAPELWAASFLRRRAATMAWTPGLVLDYARALAAVATLPEHDQRRRKASSP